MKLHRLFILTLTLTAAFALPSTSLAAKGQANKDAGKAHRAGKVVHSLDKNSNHQIDGDEVDALKKDFAAEPKGPLAALDKNGNGTLEDDEIAALNARMSKHAERAAKKGKKKSNV